MDAAPILICYDDTDGSRRAVDAAGRLFPTRRAVVVDVCPPLTAPQTSELVTTGVPGASFGNVNEELAFSRATAGVQRAHLAGLEAEVRGIVAAPTWEGITQIADEIDAAVIVIGSRGLKGLRRVFEGSVSHDVIEHAGRPVMIVPPPDGSAS